MKVFPPALFLLAAATGLPALAQTIDPVPTAQSYQPLTGPERWNRYWNGTLLSSNIYGASFASALVSQITHDPPEWRQGMAGYARRSASEYGLHIIQETVRQSGAAALGYDPRYRTCDCAGFWRRSAHAVKWSFLTRNNEGATRFDIPSVAGAYGGAMVSMSWYPHRYNALTDGVRVGNEEMGLVVGLNVIREFAPELKRAFRIRH